ncbi:hypothetical protein OIU76_007988 [Salix suchowensis]|nr:hypothetical protein OIU76_007988 [Salix suchowensis]
MEGITVEENSQFMPRDLLVLAQPDRRSRVRRKPGIGCIIQLLKREMSSKTRRLAATRGTFMGEGCKPIQEKVPVACWCHQIIATIAIHGVEAGSTFSLQLVATRRN